MHGRQRGFTLIEALITTLVLGIGLLGLGQLQARLVAASSELHSGTDAYRIAATWLEHASYQFAVNPSAISTEAALVTRRTVRYEVRPELSGSPRLARAAVVVEWNSRQGRRSIHLSTSICTEAPRSDQRWLLPGH